MRRRITLYHHDEDVIERSSLTVKSDSISGPDIKAVREDRFVLGLEELPSELQELLRATHELHIRWSGQLGYESIGPWNSRLPPGLHLFYTPQTDEIFDPAQSTQLCSLLSRVGLADCLSPDKSFTRLPNERFSHSTAYQYYQPLEQLTPFIQYAVQYACSPSEDACNKSLQSLSEATSLDFSYDTISHVVKVAAMWKHGLQPLSISGHPDHRVEVGLLTPDVPRNLEDHELGVTGLLTVLGENDEPKQTQFAYPSRHKHAAGSFSSSFLQPVGLHPNLQLLVESSKPPMKNSFCSLHAYLTLPRTIFADKYQLEDSLFLESKNLTALRFTSQPVDLEAPDYVMNVWGSSVLLELKGPADGYSPFTAEIPLHLRYQSPQQGGERSYEIPYPAVFWACAAEEGTKFPNSPFDRVNLGYDGLFGPRTLFWHLDPVPAAGSERLVMTGMVPVLDLDTAMPISIATGAVVLAGFVWVLWKILVLYLKTGYGATKSKAESNKKTQ